MRIFKAPFKSRGFTLIETVVVTAILGLLSIVIVDLIIGQYRMYQIEYSELQVQQETRASLDEIDNQVRAAMEVVPDFDIYTAGTNTLILKIQSINPANQLIPGTYDHVIFRLDGSSLMRTIVPDPTSNRVAQERSLANGVTNLVFTYNSSEFDQISEVATELSVFHDNHYQARSLTATSRARLRNH
ncbi:MAG: PilW family protein [Acidobacteriaceae bacterium]